MQKYFISNDDFVNNKITGDDVFHIKNVMRGRVGDEILVSNQNTTALAKITKLDKEVCFEIIKEALYSKII